jgi:hypothetical protein
MKRAALIIICIASRALVQAAISVTVQTIPAAIPIDITVSDLASALPGSDFVQYKAVQTGTPAIITRFRFNVTATGAQAARTWYVSVSRTTAGWGTSIPLALARTNNGTGTGTINGSTYSYTTIDGTSRQVFSGTRTRSNVGLSLRVALAAESLMAQAYTTRLTYTVTAP